MEDSEIVCVGGLMVDVSTFLKKLPQLGGSTLSDNCLVGFGGKAGNQAVAIGRLGGRVKFVGRVGSDSFGKNYIQHLNQHNIDTQFISETPKISSGVAQIFVNEDTGYNLIIGVLGANLHVSENDVQQAAVAIQKAKVVSVSLDIPIKAALEAIRLAHSAHITTIVNVAPLDSAKQLAADCNLLSEMLRHAEFFCVNESEAECFSSVFDDDSDGCIVENTCDGSCETCKRASEGNRLAKSNGLSNCALRLATSTSETQNGHVKSDLHDGSNGTDLVTNGYNHSHSSLDVDGICECAKEAAEVPRSCHLNARIGNAQRVLRALQRIAQQAGNTQLVPIITLGEQGLIYAEALSAASPIVNGHSAPSNCTKTSRFVQVAAPRVAAVDSCGASDALLAAFVFLRARENTRSLREQLRRAVHYASLTVTRRGTQSSYPFLSELAERDRALFTNRNHNLPNSKVQ